jgi:hypothetical protein
MVGSDVEMTGVKRQALDLESLRRKKFKPSELPLSATQRASMDNLLYSFKKKGCFDSVRKKVWAEFSESVSFSHPDPLVSDSLFTF